MSAGWAPRGPSVGSMVPTKRSALLLHAIPPQTRESACGTACTKHLRRCPPPSRMARICALQLRGRMAVWCTLQHVQQHAQQGPGRSVNSAVCMMLSASPPRQSSRKEVGAAAPSTPRGGSEACAHQRTWQKRVYSISWAHQPPSSRSRMALSGARASRGVLSRTSPCQNSTKKHCSAFMNSCAQAAAGAVPFSPQSIAAVVVATLQDSAVLVTQRAQACSRPVQVDEPAWQMSCYLQVVD